MPASARSAGRVPAACRRRRHRRPRARRDPARGLRRPTASMHRSRPRSRPRPRRRSRRHRPRARSSPRRLHHRSASAPPVGSAAVAASVVTVAASGVVVRPGRARLPRSVARGASNIVVGAGGGAAGSGGQAGLRGIPAKIVSIDSVRGRHRLLGKPARLGRPAARRCSLRRDDERQHRPLLVVDDERGRLAGTADVAGPPADLREVDDAVVIELVAIGQGLELGPGELQRAEPQVHPCEDEIGWAGSGDASGSSVMTAAAGSARGHAGSAPARPPRGAAHRRGRGPWRPAGCRRR